VLQADEPLKESLQQIDILITTHGIQVISQATLRRLQKGDRLIQNKPKELLDARGKSLYWLAKMSGVGIPAFALALSQPRPNDPLSHPRENLPDVEV
jgi:hypothetical protein